MENALPKTTHFSGFLSTILLAILAYSLNPRVRVVKCDGSVYDVDSDVDIDKIGWDFFTNLLQNYVP